MNGRRKELSWNRPWFLPAVFLIDTLCGDPEWFPHPVRMMGQVIAKGELVLRSPDQGSRQEYLGGALLTSTLVITTYYSTSSFIKAAHRRSATFGILTELLLGWTCLAAQSLDHEAKSVIAAILINEIALAQHRLARIVGRDTGNLQEDEICRAVIETLAESASDGVIAPLFYMALGGVPLAMTYKTINTLDSMIGHADQRYFYFGKFAARLDDVANFIPARLTALGIIAAASLSTKTDGKEAMRIWRRDGDKHKSPNAGQPESAMSGALHARLGGTNTYAGEVGTTQRMGSEYPCSTPAKATQARHLIAIVCVLGVAAGTLFALLKAMAEEPRL